MRQKQPFLETGCLPDDLLLQFNSKSSLIFDKYLPNLQKKQFWKITIAPDGYHVSRLWAEKSHKNSQLWRLNACQVFSSCKSTQNQVYFSTNSFPFSRKKQFWKITIAPDGYHMSRLWAEKLHKNSQFWRLDACQIISSCNWTVNQVYFFTNTFRISWKSNFERSP